MARYFTRADTEYLNIDSAVVGSYPWTFACWFNSVDDTTNNQVLMCLVDKDVENHRAAMFLWGSAATLNGLVQAGDGTNTYAATTNYTANTWHHGCVIMADANNHYIYLDGGGVNWENPNLTPTGLDRTSIGYLTDSSPSAPMDGAIAEAGIWSAALTSDEVSALAGGVSPLRIRPESLVAYWPLYGVGSPEPDYRGTYNLTLVNAPTQTDHAPVQPPFGLDVWAPMGLVLLPHLGGIAWGEQNPTMGESPEKWSTWSDGAGGSPTVDGDPDWGKLYLACNEEGRSLVYDLTNANPRWYTLTENRYGAGSGTATLQIRGSAASFNQDDGEPPNWENYTVPILRSWRYIQARETH